MTFHPAASSALESRHHMLPLQQSLIIRTCPCIFQTWEEYVLNMLDKNGEEEWRLAKELGQVVKDSEGNDTDIM